MRVTYYKSKGEADEVCVCSTGALTRHTFRRRRTAGKLCGFALEQQGFLVKCDNGECSFQAVLGEKTGNRDTRAEKFYSLVNRITRNKRSSRMIFEKMFNESVLDSVWESTSPDPDFFKTFLAR